MRSLALGAVWLAPISFLGCSGANSNWTDLINPWARATSTPEAAPSETSTPALAGSAPPVSSPRKRVHASGTSTAATQRTGPAASASNSKLGVPQLEDTESAGGNYPISAQISPAAAGAARASEPGESAASSPSANASETITLGEGPESSRTAATPSAATTSIDAAPAPRATPTSAAAPVNESIQAKAERMTRTVKATAKQIDQGSLSTSESSRFALASRLIRNAEKTMAEHDFAAAASLAKKASDLLAPLPRRPESMPAHR